MARAQRQYRRIGSAAAVQRRSRSQQAEHSHRSRANTGRTGASRPNRLLGATRLILLVVALAAGLIALQWLGSAWWSSDANNAAVRPIASLDAPDVHSLLVDPQDPNHLLFGSHAGIQESHDGGFTWEAGALRGVDAMSLAASSKAPETLYTAGHDVFQVSRDGGRTWQPITHNLPGTDFHGFAQDPSDPNRLYAFVVGAGTFTSADGGTTWQPLPTQPSGGGGHAVLASSGTALYAATEEGLLVSRDQGTTWERLLAQPSGEVIGLAIPASDPQVIYAGTPSGLAKSTDGGVSWTALGPDGVPVLALAVAPTEPQRVLLISDKGAVYRSNDGGTTWTAPR